MLLWVSAFMAIGLLIYQVSRSILVEPTTLWSASLKNQLPEADCGVVLTGATGRVREAFEYLAQKKIKKLIVSGVYKEARLIEVFPYLPYYNEINSNDIVLEKRSETTFGNAQQSLNLVEGLRCRDIVLITSQLHMRRAYSIFRATFPDNINIKKLTLPNAKNEQDTIDFLIELVKSFFYLVLSLETWF